MTEKDLIRKIKTLDEIKPDKDWAVLTKKQILGEFEPRKQGILEIFQTLPRVSFGYKLSYRPVFVSLAVLLVLVGVFGLSQKALPGDLLFPVKMLTEKGELLFIPKNQLAKTQLEIANRRLQELRLVAEENKIRNLATAINEFQGSVNKAAVQIKSLNDSPKLTKEIILEARKIAENKAKVESLGVVMDDTQDLNQALSALVEREIKDLEQRSLTEDQAKILVQVRDDFEAGNLEKALENLLLLTYPQQ